MTKFKIFIFKNDEVRVFFNTTGVMCNRVRDSKNGNMLAII